MPKLPLALLWRDGTPLVSGKISKLLKKNFENFEAFYGFFSTKIFLEESVLDSSDYTLDNIRVNSLDLIEANKADTVRVPIRQLRVSFQTFSTRKKTF